MHKIDSSGNVSNLFDPGDPMVPRLPTVVDADWLNAVQQELVNVIVGKGVTLVKGTWNQLAGIVNNLLDKSLTTPQTLAGNLVFGGGNVATGTAQTNQLSPGLIVKAWARVRITTGAYQLLAGQNVSSVAAGTTPTSGQFEINLAAAVPRGTRCVMAFADVPGIEAHPYDYSATMGASDTVLTLEVVDIDAAGNRTTHNLTTAGSVVLHVVVLGLQ
jgi:hypothetical protein